MTEPIATAPGPSPALSGASKRLAWLKDRVTADLQRIGDKRHRFQRWAAMIQVSTILLAGLVSILLGIDLADYEQNLKRTAFVIGVLITILNALEPTFNFRALWIAHEDAKYRMYRLQDAIECYYAGLSGTEVEETRVQEFEREHRAIWDWVSAEWLARRRSNGDARKE